MTDPLEDILSLTRAKAMLAAELRAHGPWRLEFEGYVGLKFGIVVEGQCLVAIQGRAPKTVSAGDVFLLGGVPYVMASDMNAPARSGTKLLSSAKAPVARIGSERMKPVVHLIGGRFDLDSQHAHLLLEALPAFARIPAADAGALRGATQLLVDEVRATQPGRLRALDQLTQLVLTYALRWLDANAFRTGWLRALSDPHIGAALRHIHSSVEEGTSLAELARASGMSRTAFTARFKALVGQSPLAYAIGWRMSLAKDALRTTKRPIGELAFALGYESESAFSMAFRREVGTSPRAYRNRT